MKRISFFLLCSLMSLQLFSQTDIEKLFPTLAGLQRTTFFDWFYDCRDSYSTLTMPTEIAELNGKQYLVFETSHSKTAVLLREEDNKVLIYSSAYEKDLVLYDWTLEEGDYLSYLMADVDTLFPRITVGEYKISVRTHPPYDAAEICSHFGGGGHVGAAGCTLIGDIDEIKNKMLVVCEKALVIGK